MTDDDPIPLADACALYPLARLTPSTLRAEAARGRLTIFRLGRRNYTTLAAMREMVRKCQDAERRRGCILTASDGNGLSETAHASSAQAALKTTVVALKHGLPYTSGRNINRSAGKTR